MSEAAPRAAAVAASGADPLADLGVVPSPEPGTERKRAGQPGNR